MTRKKKEERKYTPEEQAAIEKAKKISGSVLLASYEQVEEIKKGNILRKLGWSPEQIKEDSDKPTEATEGYIKHLENQLDKYRKKEEEEAADRYR